VLYLQVVILAAWAFVCYRHVRLTTDLGVGGGVVITRTRWMLTRLLVFPHFKVRRKVCTISWICHFALSTILIRLKIAEWLNFYLNQQHIITGRLKPCICLVNSKMVHINDVAKNANVECEGRETL
jgi:hypothetical protein